MVKRRSVCFLEKKHKDCFNREKSKSTFTNIAQLVGVYEVIRQGF